MTELSQETREAVRQMIETDIIHLPDQLGVDHIIPGCEVVSLDPYAVGLGVLPRYIKVKINEYNLDAFYRGGISALAVGYLVSVTHLSMGDRYEVLGASGSTGVTSSGHTPGAWLADTPVILNFEPDNPAVVTVAGVVTEYGTIALAIAAANAGEAVVIPPGTYDESITLKNGVIITELFPGTVTINSTSANTAVTCANGGYINVKEISVTRNTNVPVVAVYGNTAPAGGSTCTVIADTISATNASAGVTSYAIGIYPNTVAGVLNVYAKNLTVNGAHFAYGINELSSNGTLNAYIDVINIDGADLTYGIRTSPATTVTINVRYNVWTVSASGAAACYGAYINTGTVITNGRDFIVDGAGDAYGVYVVDNATVVFIAEIIRAYNAGTGTSITLYQAGAGVMWVYANRVQASNGDAATTAAYVDAGVQHIFASQLSIDGGTSAWSIVADCEGGEQYIHANLVGQDDEYLVGAECYAGTQEIWGDITVITTDAPGGLSDAYAAQLWSGVLQTIHGNCNASAVVNAYGAYAYSAAGSGIQTVYGHCLGVASGGVAAVLSYGVYAKEAAGDVEQNVYGNATASGGTTSVGAAILAGSDAGAVVQRVNGDTVGDIYGAKCDYGTQTITNGRAIGATTDLVRTAGTMQITSAQYDTYSGTILLLTESTHSLIAELEDTTELTIAAGVITVTQSYHRVDTQGDAASDDLDTINGGVTGRLLVLRPEDGARTVVVKHNTGNIWILAGADVTLDDINDHVMLIYDGAKWCNL